MIKILLVSFAVLFLNPVLGAKKVLPSYLKICKRSDPKLSECIRSSIESLRPYIAKGIPEMRIPPFNPLHYIHIGYDTGTVKFNFTNLDARLAHQFEIKEIQVDFENKCKLFGKILFPRLEMSGDYTLVGKLFFLELNGEGTLTGNATSSDMTVELGCNREIVNGKEHLKFKNFDIKLIVDDVKLQLNDLFKNNPQLTEATNAAIRANSKDLAVDFQTFLADGVGQMVLKIVKDVFDRFPLDMLLPK